ncbi:enoyl-CoA hydratase/isomerase family protein [Pseudonocardia xishanensis]|uniref:Enoyl-CoA hydratase/isomerase family protein n=1 Tax=Pseudonocardia xishanensis TaxID=630995 RepID=A0ABP8REB0_9PSEU
MLRAEGPHFCAGFDMTGALGHGQGELLLRMVRIEQLLQRLRRAPFLTVACVNGKGVGAGADLVAACTHRIVEQATTLRFPGLRFGVCLGTRHLAALVGVAQARAVLLNAHEVDADEAARIGLAAAVVDRDRQLAVARELVDATRHLDTTSLAAALALLDTGSDEADAADMAALVGSVARPGLVERLGRYLDRPPARR